MASMSEQLRVLVAFATTHGHTGKIAGRISEALREAGAVVDSCDLGEAPGPDRDPSGYDLVVAGGSLHAGRHQAHLASWVSERVTELNAMPSAFFSVSLTAADDTDEARAATWACVGEFLEETGWRPRKTATFAGALQYREYDLFTRTLMKLKMHSGGHTTDASRDHEFTDWNAVAEFARECPALVEETQAAAP